MTAAALAEHLRARSTGAGRWLARCPAHRDRTPSLSLRDGADGKVLLHCWTGCATAAVLAAAGLTWADIGGAPATPAGRARLRREHAERDAAEAAQRRRAEALAGTAEEQRARAGRIAARLAVIEFAGAAAAHPGEAEALAADYHAALAALRELQEAA